MTEQERTVILKLKKQAERNIKEYNNLLGVSEESAWERFRKMTPAEQGEYIISGVCDFYEVQRKDFVKKTKSPVVSRRRYYAVKLMSQYGTMTQEMIAQLNGFANHSQANHAIKEMNERLSEKAYGDESTRAMYHNIVEYLEFPHKPL